MQKITTTTELKDSIQLLECRHSNEWLLLKEQLLDTCENLKPINIVKNTLKEAYAASDLKTNIAKGILGIGAGFLTKKIFIGKSHNPVAKLAGFLLELFMANKVAKSTDGIKSLRNGILNKMMDQHDSINT
jgi:hypothetical protein